MWHLFALHRILFLLLLHVKCYLWATDCKWTVVVNVFNKLGRDRHIFFQQTAVFSVTDIFKLLVDSAVDNEDKSYMGYPYYLKINLTCSAQDSETAIRTAHYTGLRPMVTVSFKEPVHSVMQKQEQLQIEMRAAPFKIKGNCDSEDVCRMCWYVPMPLMNGSAVMDVMVQSNDLGLPVESKRFSIGVNGYTTVVQNKRYFKIGTEVPITKLKTFLSLQDKSRPLWCTYNQAPVLILGGVTDSKIVLMSDTGFEDFFAVEVGIDSCWIGSLSCPQEKFSSSIIDSVSTESTLFIRQNQLVYYFTGSYITLFMNTSGSELWTRILNNVCVRKLNPVSFSENDTEYVIALGGGWQDGEFFLISSKDGVVKVSKSIKYRGLTVCGFLKTARCSIVWAIFYTQQNIFILLVNVAETNHNFIIMYYREQEYFQTAYELPEFVPKATDKGFVMLLGLEQYTNIRLIARGLALNTFSMLFYIWGNVILQSKDFVNYIYISSFPSTSIIKYFVLSYDGEFACVTDNDEIWVSFEGSSVIKQVYPSKAWDVYSTLKVMEGSQDYGLQEALISVFFDRDGLQQLVYMEDTHKERLIKRKFPLHHILTYDQLSSITYKSVKFEENLHIKFTHPCPFAIMRFLNLPLPQRFTRTEHYRAEPPDIMDLRGFHDKKSLAVYQGLVFKLLTLHSAYNRPYADPVHDPTYRWWKNKKEYADYYYYIASNRNSSGGIYVDMNNYVKIYNLRPNNLLPSMIYLDKNCTYTFHVYLTIRTSQQSMEEAAEEDSLDSVWLTIILAHPEYLHGNLQRQELISRGSVLYAVTVTDAGLYPKQELSGKNLLKSSLVLKVARSGMDCYHYTAQGPELKGNNFMAVNIGCPPGKRLAFDITGTVAETSLRNKRYFDCVYKDPEMPCFFFRDVFYPFFLIQDMVTGDSGHFYGSYVFMIIGGGKYEIRRFSKKEILLYNTMNGSETSSLIWVRVNNDQQQTDSQGFHIFSRNNSGIVWVCGKNSPCYDIFPTGMSAPDYYFMVKVSNRGVDQTTYCDYALEFIIHVHGLRLSSTQSIDLVLKLTWSVIGMVSLYVLIYVMGPKVKAFMNRTFWRLKEVFAFRVESSLTFSSSFTSQGSLQNIPSTSSDNSPAQSIFRGITKVPAQPPQ